MAKIRFVRKYDAYRESWFDVVYERDGYITRVRTCVSGDLPKTVMRWLEWENGRKQYDPVYRREEIVYE